MIRYTSSPNVHVDVQNGGHVVWEKYLRVLEIDEDHTARYYHETTETSHSGTPRTPTVLEGRVTTLIEDRRMSVEVKRSDSDKTVSIYCTAGSGELICELVSQFTSSRIGLLLTPRETDRLLPRPLSVPDSERRPEPRSIPPLRPAPTAPPQPAAPVMVLKPGDPVSGAAFTKPWTRLNRHLRRHGGRSNVLRKADLSDADLEFLARLFSGPLRQLEAHALEDIDDFYAGHGGYAKSVHVTSLALPSSPGGTWEITLGETTWGGVVIVYTMAGWTVREAILVG